MKFKIAIAALVAVVVICVGVFSMNVTLDNKEVRMRSTITAQEAVLEANFDKMWKVIKQIAAVPGEAAAQFAKMYQPLIEGRYGGEKGDPFMKWITEQNPAFDWTLYGKLQTAIQANRNEFFLEQKKLQSLADQHRQLIKTWPGTWFISADEIQVTLISSSKTKAIMESGLEEDVELFKKES
jgi:hypothetical protein